MLGVDTITKEVATIAKEEEGDGKDDNNNEDLMCGPGGILMK